MIKFWKNDPTFRLIVYIFVVFFLLVIIAVKIQEKYFPVEQPHLWYDSPPGISPFY